MIRLSKRIKKLRTPRGFDELFEKELPKHDTYKEAYEYLESEFIEVFGERRYSNYESYRKTREKRLRLVHS